MEPNPIPQSFDQTISDIYYTYNKSIQEYYKTLQRSIEIQNHTNAEVAQNMMYYMNLNIQPFHAITKQCIETMREVQLQSYTRPTPPPPPPPPVPRPQTPLQARPQTPVRYPVSANGGGDRTFLFDITNAFSQLVREPAATAPPPQSQRRGLTSREIRQFTQDYIWTRDDSDEVADASGNVCPISLARFRPGNQITRIRACNHQFKRSFLMRWLERDRRCPVCRRDITTPRQNSVQPPPPPPPAQLQRTPEFVQEPEPDEEEVEEEEETTIDHGDGPDHENMIQRFLSNELGQIINDDVAEIIRQMAGTVEGGQTAAGTTTAEIDTPLGTIEISREVIPIDIEYRIRGSGNQDQDT